MYVKDFRAKVKAAGSDNGLEDGQFEAIVSVFDTEDSVGDVVMHGAFGKSLADWEERGDPIPVIWSHDWSDPFSHIGHVLGAEETEQGLKVRGQLDLDNSKAHQVYRLLKGRRVTQFSFAYDIEDGGFGERDGKDVYELRELTVHEVGPCLLGVNQSTELLAAKARSLAERGVKTDVEAIRSAYDTLGQILAETEDDQTASDSDEDEEDDEETGQESDETATDDDPTGKSAASQPATPAQVLASITLQRITGGTHVHAG